MFEHLPKILNSKHKKIYEQGAWAVGNIAADEGGYKDLLINYNVIEPITQKIIQTNDEAILKQSCWALCNMIGGGQPSVKKYYAVPALLKIIDKQSDLEMLCSALSALLSLMEPKLVELLIKGNLVRRLIDLCKLRYKAILFPLLQIISYITNGSDEQTQSIINNGGVETVFDLLTDEKMDLHCKRECLWIISNIVVGTYEQMNYVFSRSDWINTLLRYCTDANPKVKFSF